MSIPVELLVAEFLTTPRVVRTLTTAESLQLLEFSVLLQTAGFTWRGKAEISGRGKLATRKIFLQPFAPILQNSRLPWIVAV